MTIHDVSTTGWMSTPFLAFNESKFFPYCTRSKQITKQNSKPFLSSDSIWRPQMIDLSINFFGDAESDPTLPALWPLWSSLNKLRSPDNGKPSNVHHLLLLIHFTVSSIFNWTSRLIDLFHNSCPFIYSFICAVNYQWSAAALMKFSLL